MLALEKLSKTDVDADVRRAALGALGALRSAGVCPPAQDPGALGEAVRKAAEDLASEAWAARREACGVLGRAGPAAAPHVQALVGLARREKDLDVRKAAQKAIQELEAAGVPCVATEEEDDDVVNRAIKSLTAPKRKPRTRERGVMRAPAEIRLLPAPEGPAGPHVDFQILREVLPMRLEREAATPHEIAEIWERKWGVQYASQIHFIVGEEPDARLLDRGADTLPLSPEKVRLHIRSPGILFSLAAALKLYGETPADEVFERRERIRKERELEAQRRKEELDALLEP